MKTSIIHKSIILAALVAAASACGNIATDGGDGDGQPDGPYLKVKPGLPIVFTAEALEVHIIAVETDQEEWDVLSDRDWCVVGDKTADGFTLSAHPNFDAAPPQTATVTITAGELTPYTLIVTQLGYLDPLRFYDYLIATEQDLIDFRKAVFAAGAADPDGFCSLTAVLTADIELTEPWIPIGLDEDGTGQTRFKGIFNGNGKTISGLTIAEGNFAEAGLFARVEDAVLNGVKLADVDISNTAADAVTGALVGRAAATEGGRCVVALCSVTGSVEGGGVTGGLVGQSDGACITRSNSEAAVTSVSTAGGVVGVNSGIVAASWAQGGVSAESSSDGEVTAGGLAGRNTGNIFFSYSTGEVSARGTAPASERAGGLVGHNFNETAANSVIGSCYSTANASASDGANNVGSFVGYFQVGTIEQCHSSGTPERATGGGMPAEVNTAEGECGKTVGAPAQEGSAYTAEGIFTTVADINNRYLFSVKGPATFSSERVWSENALPEIVFTYTGQ